MLFSPTFLVNGKCPSAYLKTKIFLFAAIRMQVSSYENAESSDDDIYCDSYNPDEVMLA